MTGLVGLHFSCNKHRNNASTQCDKQKQSECDWSRKVGDNESMSLLDCIKQTKLHRLDDNLYFALADSACAILFYRKQGDGMDGRLQEAIYE